MSNSVRLVALLLLCPLPAFAGILGHESLTVDLTKVEDAQAKVTWSEPEKINVTANGLGWDGESNALRDGWIETKPLPIGLSWRPAQSANVRVALSPGPKEVTLPNGQKYTPYFGTIYVRHSPDAKHWSSWQPMRHGNWSEKEKQEPGAPLVFTGNVGVPNRDRAVYNQLFETYRGLDVPWTCDEEAAVKWMVKQQPDFFAKNRPFVGYVQFLFDGSFHGGQRLTKLEATAGWGVGGITGPAKDEEVTKNREVPWRYKAQ